MGATPNCGFFSVSPDEYGLDLIKWIESVDGNVGTSNIMLIDALIAKLEAMKANKVVESSSQPEGLISGDEWDRLL